jgi:hypothetical protein
MQSETYIYIILANASAKTATELSPVQCHRAVLIPSNTYIYLERVLSLHLNETPCIQATISTQCQN